MYRQQTKRALGFRILHTAVRSGINLEELSSHLGRSVTTWLIGIDGTLNSAEFTKRASQISTKFGKYDLGRFFCDDEDLVHSNDRTYAITNQWSISDVPALKTITEFYPFLDLSFIKAELLAK